MNEIQLLNRQLLEPRGLEEVAKRLTPDILIDILYEFPNLPSHIKCCYLQTVLFLDEEQFSKIESAYRRVLDAASKSDDPWVLKTYEHFKNYPIIENNEEPMMFPFETQSFDEYNPFKITSEQKSVEIHVGQNDKFNIAPPSQYTKKPVAPSTPGLVPKPSYKQQSAKQTTISMFLTKK